MKERRGKEKRGKGRRGVERKVEESKGRLILTLTDINRIPLSVATALATNVLPVPALTHHTIFQQFEFK